MSFIRRLYLNRLLPAGIALCIAAALQLFWVAPLVNRMPASGVDETHVAAEIRSRDTLTGPWSDVRLTGRRVDRTLIHSGDHVIVEGNLHWSTDDGTPTFEGTGIYGVDRRTRTNLPGYGDTDRSGQFLFPPHTPRGEIGFWDSSFGGPRTAHFERDDRVDGLAVLVFRFTAKDIDETAGYAHLAEVPERYRAHTDAGGRLWIEPVSGVVVEYEDHGTSYFVEHRSSTRVGDFYVWKARYKDATRAAKLQEAREARRRILAAEVGLPSVLLLAGVVCVALGARQFRRQTNLVPAPAS